MTGVQTCALPISIRGVQLIVTCRSHRKKISLRDVPCEDLELKPFTVEESRKYLRDRIRDVGEIQIQVAFSRSEGNPRILEHLISSDRGLLEPSELKRVVKLDDLIDSRIRKGLQAAQNRGYKQADIKAFLAGLSVLPPPVPLEEYANAHGIELTAVQSFAADLAPLLELTKHGLMFRDEPTETCVRENYAADKATLRRLAKNLFNEQGSSVYAASALPGLLQQIDDSRSLFKLAFDERFPKAISTAVGKTNIRYARLKAAVLHAARKEDFNRLVPLLVELSTLAAVNERGTDYVIQNPDLVIASQDVDATRRLFETRTPWPGTRHARLAIARALTGDISDALRHAVQADEWTQHYYRQDEQKRMGKSGPQALDIASIPICLVAEGRAGAAARYLKRWKDWYAFEVCEEMFSVLEQGRSTQAVSDAYLDNLLKDPAPQLGTLAAAASFLMLARAPQR